MSTMGEVKCTCPFCKEKFKYMAQFSYSTFGQNLDFKPFGAATIPTPIPKCPKCNIVFIEKLFSKKDVTVLKERLEKDNIFEKEPDMPDYYYLAKEFELLGKNNDEIIYYYNCAIWEDYEFKYFKHITTLFFKQLKKVDNKNKNYYIYRLIELDYLRRLKQFDNAKKLILELVEDKSFPEEYMPVLDKQHDLIKKKDTGEHEMPDLNKKVIKKKSDKPNKKPKEVFTPIKPLKKPINEISETFDYGKANENQKTAISTTDGAVLITAGPGTGKTFTLVQRALYLIQEKGVKPEEIMMATFTEKAAKELITRISNTLLKKKILLNLNEMYIGTFHSICLRFIKENLEYSAIKKNYRTLDDFDQKYIIMRNMNQFEKIDNFHLVI